MLDSTLKLVYDARFNCARQLCLIWKDGDLGPILALSSGGCDPPTDVFNA